MKNFWKVVNDVINNADVIILVLDARMVDETRNTEIEWKVRKQGKPLIYAVNKCDLMDKDVVEKSIRHLNPAVFVSAKEHLGTTLLRQRILIEAKRIGKGDKVYVGVLGYPNVGKSSLINSLKGRSVASTSVLSGHTKGIMKVKMDNKIMLLDTPGVIPYKEKEEFKHSVIGTIDFTKEKDPDMVVMQLMKEYPGKIEKYYKVEPKEDPEEVIEEIAKKSNVLKRGGIPDLSRMARMILKDWQKGEIK